jgi:hypothetical protein
MTIAVSRIYGVAAAVVLTAGLSSAAFAQGAGQPAGGTGGGSAPAPASGAQGYEQTGADQNAAGPAGAQHAAEVPILYVTGIEVVHGTLDPKVDVIRVTGLASSQGWSNPQLVPFFYGKPADDVLDMQFIAQSPEQSQKAEGYMPVSASFTLEAGHSFKGVRVRAAANALTLKQMNGTATAQPKTDGCKECVGKKFVEKGKGQAAAGTIRGEDLPPDYRPIGPDHGVKGMVHNPNRINLILDEGDKIVMAFWE